MQPYGSEGSDGVASPDDRDETGESDLLASTNGKTRIHHVPILTLELQLSLLLPPAD